MKPIFLPVLWIVLYASPAAAQGERFAVNGTVRGAGNDSVVLFVTQYTADGRRNGADTFVTKALNDRFFLGGRVEKPKLVWAQIGGMKSRKSFSFFLEEGTITVEGRTDSFDALSVTGTPSNNDMTAARAYTNRIYQRIRTAQTALKSLAEGSDDYRRLYADVARKYDSVDAYERSFISTHPASQMSGVYLYVRQDKLPVDELEVLYNSLSPEARQNDLVLMIPSKITARRSVAVGRPAPDFTSVDTAGRRVQLSDYKGKTVLLEFWASWCVPCRKQSPHLKELYRRYAAKGFDILQYSLDTKEASAKWREAIRQDGLLWTQISDLNGFDSGVAKLYGVQPIPDNFLIDPSGKILARGLAGDELENKLKSLLEQ